jgi:hypothetical protein
MKIPIQSHMQKESNIFLINNTLFYPQTHFVREVIISSQVLQLPTDWLQHLITKL